MLRKNSGITLISLVVIIIVILILAGTATYTGIASVQSARIATFEAELKTVRLQLNSSSEIEKYKKLDTDKLTDAQIKFLNDVQTELNNENLGITLDIDNFKYFSKQDIKNLSSIEITRDVYVDAINKIVVSSIAEQYDGKTYYILEQLEDNVYNVEENIENSGDITFETKANDLTVEVSNITYNAPYVNKGTIQYKLNTDKNWTTVAQDTTSKNVSFNVSEYGIYNIRVIDAKNNENETNLIVDKSVLEHAKEAMPTGAHIDTATNEDTGIVMIDSNKNEWAWIEVPLTVFITAKNSIDYNNIKADLIAYASDYREGSKGENCNWIDEWYAKDGNTLVTASTEGLTETQKLLNNGCGLTYNEYNTNYNKMLSSIYKNKGFYIGRYEAGIEGSDTNTSLARYDSAERITSSSPKAVSKQNMIPYNWIYCNEAQQLANKMATGTKTSSLMYGIQWDLVCKFLEVRGNWDTSTNIAKYYIKEDSTTWGNYSNSSITLVRGKYSANYGKTWTLFNKNTENYVTSSKTNSNTSYYQLITTGASESTNKMNIYDFVGNEWEWTLEKTTNTEYPCSDRGGGYYCNGFDYPASYRGSNAMIYGGDFIGLRSSLY